MCSSLEYAGLLHEHCYHKRPTPRTPLYLAYLPPYPRPPRSFNVFLHRLTTQPLARPAKTRSVVVVGAVEAVEAGVGSVVVGVVVAAVAGVVEVAGAEVVAGAGEGVFHLARSRESSRSKAPRSRLTKEAIKM